MLWHLLIAEELQAGNPRKVRCISGKQGNVLSYADAGYKDVLITDQFPGLESNLLLTLTNIPYESKVDPFITVNFYIISLLEKVMGFLKAPSPYV